MSRKTSGEVYGRTDGWRRPVDKHASVRGNGRACERLTAGLGTSDTAASNSAACVPGTRPPVACARGFVSDGERAVSFPPVVWNPRKSEKVNFYARRAAERRVSGRATIATIVPGTEMMRAAILLASRGNARWATAGAGSSHSTTSCVFVRRNVHRAGARGRSVAKARTTFGRTDPPVPSATSTHRRRRERIQHVRHSHRNVSEFRRRLNGIRRRLMFFHSNRCCDRPNGLFSRNRGAPRLTPVRHCSNSRRFFDSSPPPPRRRRPSIEWNTIKGSFVFSRRRTSFRRIKRGKKITLLHYD